RGRALGGRSFYTLSLCSALRGTTTGGIPIDRRVSRRSRPFHAIRCVAAGGCPVSCDTGWIRISCALYRILTIRCTVDCPPCILIVADVHHSTSVCISGYSRGVIPLRSIGGNPVSRCSRPICPRIAIDSRLSTRAVGTKNRYGAVVYAACSTTISEMHVANRNTSLNMAFDISPVRPAIISIVIHDIGVVNDGGTVVIIPSTRPISREMAIINATGGNEYPKTQWDSQINLHIHTR